MDFLASTEVVLRRWRVVVALLVLTAVGTLFAVSSVQPAYSARGTVLLTFPSHIADPDTGETNSYLAFGNLTVVANVLTEVLQQGTMRDRLHELGATAPYAIGMDPASTTPLITVSATGEQEDVVPTVEAVMAAISDELERRQRSNGAPETTWIRAETVTAPEGAIPQLGSRARVGAAVGILGVAGSISMAFAVEALVLRNRVQAERSRGGASDDTEGQDQTPLSTDRAGEDLARADPAPEPTESQWPANGATAPLPPQREPVELATELQVPRSQVRHRATTE